MKYFYSDNLSALWMEAKFDIKLTSVEGDEVCFTDDYNFCRRFADPFYCDKAYIHPDNLHILQPQVGDLIHNGCCGLYYKVCEPYMINGQCDITEKQAIEWFQSPDAKIILRNGMAFIWPESE